MEWNLAYHQYQHNRSKSGYIKDSNIPDFSCLSLWCILSWMFCKLQAMHAKPIYSRFLRQVQHLNLIWTWTGPPKCVQAHSAQGSAIWLNLNLRSVQGSQFLPKNWTDLDFGSTTDVAKRDIYLATVWIKRYKSRQLHRKRLKKRSRRIFETLSSDCGAVW